VLTQAHNPGPWRQLTRGHSHVFGLDVGLDAGLGVGLDFSLGFDLSVGLGLETGLRVCEGIGFGQG
jgi:hypothetical protein